MAPVTWVSLYFSYHWSLSTLFPSTLYSHVMIHFTIRTDPSRPLSHCSLLSAALHLTLTCTYSTDFGSPLWKTFDLGQFLGWLLTFSVHLPVTTLTPKIRWGPPLLLQDYSALYVIEKTLPLLQRVNPHVDLVIDFFLFDHSPNRSKSARPRSISPSLDEAPNEVRCMNIPLGSQNPNLIQSLRFRLVFATIRRTICFSL